MTVTIKVKPIGKISYRDDRDVPGEYEIDLPDGATHVASCALDSFHEDIAIKNLDEFEIWVEDQDGNVIEEEDDGPDSYESEYRGDVYKI